MSDRGSSNNVAMKAVCNAGAASPQWEVLRRGWTKQDSTDENGAILGECPVWCAEKQTLYWLDIEASRLHRCIPTRRLHESVKLPSGSMPGSLGLVDGHPEWIWVCCTDGVHLFEWDTRRSALIATFPDTSAHRFNDGKVDERGDLIVSTMIKMSDAKKRAGAGRLWRLTAQGNSGGVQMLGACNRMVADVILGGLTIPNGLDWIDPDNDKWHSAANVGRHNSNGSSTFFFIDTPTNRVMSFDYVPRCWSRPLQREKIAFRTEKIVAVDGSSINGQPDGMAIDEEGGIWIAMTGSGRVCRFSPGGELLRSTELPVSKVTSLCFGGPQLDQLFVTSASKGVDRKKEPLAGSLFVIRNVGVRGKEVHKLKGKFSMEERDAIIQRHPLIPQRQLHSKL